MAERQPAPAGLALVQAFVNSADIEEGTDELSDPEGLAAWLSSKGAAESPLPADHSSWQRALALREALRGLLLANNGGPLYPVDVATLNLAAQRSLLRVRFQPDGGGRLEPQADGVDGVLGRVLAAVFTAMAEGSWPRLKACRKHSCRWAFYDQSKNHSSTWCKMAVCGSQTKAMNYRRRRKAAGSGRPDEPRSIPASSPT